MMAGNLSCNFENYFNVCFKSIGRIPFYEKVIFVQIILIGILGGAASTYSALIDLFGPDSFTTPCYIRIS